MKKSIVFFILGLTAVYYNHAFTCVFLLYLSQFFWEVNLMDEEDERIAVKNASN